MHRLLCCAAVALFVLMGAPQASAQETGPRYAGSRPVRGKVVHRPPSQVEVTFDAPLDPSSQLAVSNECGDRVSKEPRVRGRTISAAISRRFSGEYVVRYSARAQRGAGPTGGVFTFSTHAGRSCGKTRPGEGHGAGGSGNPGGWLFQSEDGSLLRRKLSPQMSLAVALLIPALAGLVGGVLLRRRFSEG